MKNKKMDSGEAAIRLTRAAINTGTFPDTVPDTPANQAMFTKIKGQVAEMIAQGITPDVPNDGV